MKVGLLAEPAWCLGTIVWICATLVFPLRLGWSGADVLALAAYLPVAAALLLAADVLYNRRYYGSWRQLRVQFALFVFGLCVPGMLAFGLGRLAASANDDPGQDLPGASAFEAYPAAPGAPRIELPSAGA